MEKFNNNVQYIDEIKPLRFNVQAGEHVTKKEAQSIDYDCFTLKRDYFNWYLEKNNKKVYLCFERDCYGESRQITGLGFGILECSVYEIGQIKWLYHRVAELMSIYLLSQCRYEEGDIENYISQDDYEKLLYGDDEEQRTVRELLTKEEHTTLTRQYKENYVKTYDIFDCSNENGIKTSRKSGYVYLMKDLTNNFIKIGFSSN